MISSRDSLINALGNNASRIILDKASLANTVAGQFFSLWQANGFPAPGATPTGVASVCTLPLLGAPSFDQQTAPATSYLAWHSLLASNSNTSVEVHDRLAHVGGLSGTVTTAQGALSLVTTAPSSARLGDATNFSDVQWWLEVYSPLGSTAVNATVNVTYNNNSTGNLTAFSLAATPRAGRLYPLISASPGLFIKAVNSVTLSATTGTAGNFGITATRQRSVLFANVANKAESFDWAMLGFPELPNDTCLMYIVPCSTTTTGTIRGQGKVAHG